jgi:hypothetical protein
MHQQHQQGSSSFKARRRTHHPHRLVSLSLCISNLLIMVTMPTPPYCTVSVATSTSTKMERSRQHFVVLTSLRAEQPFPTIIFSLIV